MDMIQYNKYLNIIKSSDNRCRLRDIPEEYRTEELSIIAVSRDGWDLKFVTNQTEALCLAAVNKTGNALSLVENQTPEICMAAVKQYGGSLDWVKEQSPELCMEAVRNYGIALRHVRSQTPQICLAAIKDSHNAIAQVIDMLGLAYIVEDDFIEDVIKTSIYGHLYTELKEIKHKIKMNDHIPKSESVVRKKSRTAL